MIRELMAITGLSAQELVRIALSDAGKVGGRATACVHDERAAATGIDMRGQRPVTNAADLAEAVMGSESWDTYKNSEFKTMKGSRKPHGATATKKNAKERKVKLKGSLAGWTLQVEPEHFAGVDTRWTMDQTLTWLPPDGNVNHAHLETLGYMISEAFYQHKAKVFDAARNAKKSSTVTKASEWVGDTSVGADFFKRKK